METVVLLLTVLVALAFVVKLSFNSPVVTAVIAVVCAFFLGLSADAASLQSKTQIADWLANPALMLDTSVLLTVDVALQMAFCILFAGVIAGSVAGRWAGIATKVLLWVPGILIFPVLFSMLVAAIFAMPGTDFALTGWLCAAAVLLLAPALRYLMRWALPEREARLELLFLLELLVAMLGVVATVNGRTAVAGVGETELLPLAGVFGILLAGGAVGLVLNLRRRSKLLKAIKRID